LFIDIFTLFLNYTAKNSENKVCPFLESEDFFSQNEDFFSQNGELFADLREKNAHFERKESSISRKRQIFSRDFLQCKLIGFT